MWPRRRPGMLSAVPISLESRRPLCLYGCPASFWALLGGWLGGDFDSSHTPARPHHTVLCCRIC